MRSFEISDWVTLNLESHPWHGMSFQVETIYKSYLMTTRVVIKYGDRGVTVSPENLIKMELKKNENSNSNF